MQNIYDKEVFFDEYKSMREKPINANNLIEIPAMKKLLPFLKGKRVLDLGCGMGEMTKYYSKLGASFVLGVDISQNMLDIANKTNKLDNIEYKLLPLEEIDKINDKFDVVISSLAFHYIQDYNKLIKDIYNLLNNDGILLFSQENPIGTCFVSQNKIANKLDIEGKRYYLVSDYNNNGLRKNDWNDCAVEKYHRNFTVTINTLIFNKFTLLEIQEPVASKEAIELEPKYKNQFDRPYFLIIKCKK